MLSYKQISYLTGAERAKHLYARVVAGLALLAGGVLPVIFSAGTFATVAGILVAVAVFLLAKPATMLVADRLVGSQDQAVIAETGQKLADGKAAVVHALVLEQLRDAGKAPQSLVIAVFNNSWDVGGPIVAASTIGADGVPVTKWIDDEPGRWQVLNVIATPFLTGTDWQATVISAAPGQPATAQLVDAAGYDELWAESNKPSGEQFLRYHRIPAAAG